MVCRRYPPKMMAAQRINPLSHQPEVMNISIFPSVTDSMSCGERKTELAAV